MSKKSKTDSLTRGSPPEQTEAPAAGASLFVYKAHADPKRRHLHTGERVFLAGALFVSVLPGLNLLDGDSAAGARAHGAAHGVKSVELDDIDEIDVQDLAERTEQHAALEMLLARELAKPTTGSGARRDSTLVETLKKRVRMFAGRKPLHVSNLYRDATAAGAANAAS